MNTSRLSCGIVACLLTLFACFVRAAVGGQAEEILEATGIKGGLIVHLGSGDGKLTAALRANDSYLVHGLDRRAKRVEKAREHIKALGVYGDVSVDSLRGNRLPYVDNMVTLVVSEDLGRVKKDEVMRVLAPGGVAYIKEDDKWSKTVKARPEEIDEWTHFLYDSTNNAVSKDTVVGPPDQLQWVVEPRWARSHDHLASVSGAVCSAGRIFYIVDEGPIAAVVLEPKWRLVARDAFSGVLLWKRDIGNWQWHLRGFRSGPSDIARRLVAVGERVYVTLDITGPVCALDAATGQTVKTYDQTEAALEVVHCDGKLYVVAGDAAEQKAVATVEGEPQRPGFTTVHTQRPGYLENPPSKRIVALEADSGEVIWTRNDAEARELMPTTLAVKADRVFFQSPNEIICADAGNGEDVWRAKRPTSITRFTWSAPTLVVYGDVVLSADRALAEKKTLEEDEARTVEWVLSSRGGQAPVGELIAFSAKDGKELWRSKARECYNAPIDVLVSDGLVWTGSIVRASDPGVTEGLDPVTGQAKRTRPKDQTFFQAGMGHQRCYRNKATDRFLVFGRSGVEFIDVATGQAIPNHWVRGTCQYGVIPCNGLLYAPPHSCACFIRSKLNGFNCLAPKRSVPKQGASKGRKRARLEKGPAYSKIKESSKGSIGDWPTYRRDNTRSGTATVAVAAKLEKAWEQKVGGKLTSCVVGEGKVLVASEDTHTVHALDAGSGKGLWHYTAGGRVDSPPTVWRGRALFGSADGYVHCLRASDGAVAWRFRAAPDDQRIVSYGQIESLWPVSGSVMVREGQVYCAAGRSSYLAGGIRLCRLDAETGKLLSETIVDDRDPNTGFQRKGTVRGTNMPGALPDVLSCDGSSVYMRHRRFDLAGVEQKADVEHMFSPAGFLDDTWWHRTYWMIGTAIGTNYGGWPNVGNRVPAGRILAVDGDTVYGFGRNQYIHHGAHIGIDGATVFHFRPDRDTPRRFTHYRAFAAVRGGKSKLQQGGAKSKRAQPPAAGKYRWTQKLPVLTRAMVLAKDRLFMAGPPDLFDSDSPAAALEGGEGGLLCVLSTADGKLITKYDLKSPPVFDGMAAAGGKLYMATLDGRVVCMDGND
ncbi:MAG: outer membrane protein assembly factor BamB family protein [Planctomycetota bacterium]